MGEARETNQKNFTDDVNSIRWILGKIGDNDYTDKESGHCFADDLEELDRLLGVAAKEFEESEFTDARKLLWKRTRNFTFQRIIDYYKHARQNSEE